MTEGLRLPFWDVPMLNAGLFRLASDENVDGLRNMLALLNRRLSVASREHDIAISHHFAAYLAWLEDDHEKASIAIDAACRIALDSGFCLSPIYYGVGQAAVLEVARPTQESAAAPSRGAAGRNEAAQPHHAVHGLHGRRSHCTARGSESICSRLPPASV